MRHSGDDCPCCCPRIGTRSCHPASTLGLPRRHDQRCATRHACQHRVFPRCSVAEEAREGERRQREGAAYQTPEQRAEAARAARQAAAEGRAEREEARVAEKRFDPARDYYQLLGIPRWASGSRQQREPHASMPPCMHDACSHLHTELLPASGWGAWPEAATARLPPPDPASRPACACRGASAADVRRTYKRLALLYHPDKHKAEGVEQQAAIQEKFKQARGGAST